VFYTEAFAGLERVDFTRVEAFQDDRDQGRWATFQKLLFFMGLILHEKHPAWPVILGRFSLK
jgi:hypothetical protein